VGKISWRLGDKDAAGCTHMAAQVGDGGAAPTVAATASMRSAHTSGLGCHARYWKLGTGDVGHGQGLNEAWACCWEGQLSRSRTLACVLQRAVGTLAAMVATR
jgi:hypothetical protein